VLKNLDMRYEAFLAASSGAKPEIYLVHVTLANVLKLCRAFSKSNGKTGLKSRRKQMNIANMSVTC